MTGVQTCALPISNRLAENYYGQYVTAAEQGGMKAVAELDHFKEIAEMSEDNRKKLLATDVNHFKKVMMHWREYFLAGVNLPVIGATAEDLASLKLPTCIIPGNDLSHPRPVARTAQQHIKGSELFDILGPDLAVDVAPPEQWHDVADKHVQVVVDFLAKNGIHAG